MNVNPAQPSWTVRAWAGLSALVLFSILTGFFDRAALFHDEIINTGKASNGLVFDYALRPVFYAINQGAVMAFGHHPLSLSFVMIIGFFVGGWYTYSYLARDYGHAAAAAGVVGYAWLGWVYSDGISAMPHLLPAVFVLGAVYLFHGRLPERLGLPRIAAISLLLWLAVLTHPTAAALLLAFVAMAGCSIMTGVWRRRYPVKTAAKQVLAWGCCFALLLLATEIAFREFAPGAGGFISGWVEGLTKVSNPRFSRYFEPYGFYFEAIAARFLPLLPIAFVAIVLVVAKAARKAPPSVESRSRDANTKLVELFIFCIVALAVLSLEDWKFQRVLATFAPFVSLFLVATIYRGIQALGKRSAAVATGVTVFMTLWAGNVFVDQVTATEHLSERRRATYSSFFEEVRMLDASKIAYLGRKGALSQPLYPVVGNDKTLVHVAWPADAGEAHAAYIEALMEAGFRYLIVDLRDDRGYVQGFRSEMARLGMQRRATYFIGNYELWDMAPVYLGRNAENSLDTLPRKASVAVVHGLPGRWLAWTLADKGFRVSTLKHPGDARKIAAAIEKRKPQAIVTGAGDDQAARAIGLLLRRDGYVPVADGRIFPSNRGGFQVWMKNKG